MTNKEISKLLIKTFDGLLVSLNVKPKNTRTKVEFNLRYYDYDGDGGLKKARMIFHNVVSLDFEVNYFDNCIGAELFGFYEIYDEEMKRMMLERVFESRRTGYLMHGDCDDYDPNDEADMLNYRVRFCEIENNLKQYHLYQQQTEGGIYYILAERYELVHKREQR